MMMSWTVYAVTTPVFTAFLHLALPFASAFPIARQNEAQVESSDRSSTWQVLADGTQDLAALVGLFATDSVERYAVDYSRGYLGAALAPCSMFGILGYVRALIKLAIGTEACVAAAFPTAPVRSILGAPPQDRLPGDELVTVNYLERTQVGDAITWRLIKSVAHTKESMPATWAHNAVASSDQMKPAFFLLEAERESKKYISKQSPPRRWHVVLAILVSTCVNSFLILSIGDTWPWFKLVASAGMFVALFGSSLTWATVYMTEQVPIFGEADPVYLDQEGEVHRRPCGSVSLKTSRKDSQICVIERGGSYVLLPCKTLSGRGYMLCRIGSGILAAVITLGYICQYIVVRSSTETQSLAWLLVQGALTLFRVLVWVYPSQWVPSIFDQKNVVYTHLRRPAFSDFQSSSGTLLGSGLDSYEKFQELELATVFSSFGVGLDEITLPIGPLRSLQNIALAPAFTKALKAEDAYVQEVTLALEARNLSWDMNPLLFRKLLLQRIDDPSLKTLERSNKQILGDLTAKVLDLVGTTTWDEARPVLVPLVRVSFQLEALDEADRRADRRLEQGWCTCFSQENPNMNLVEVFLDQDSQEPTWVPFSQVLPAPKTFRLGTFPKFRVVCETGEAGDLSIDSELTVQGYRRKWGEFSGMLTIAARLLQEAADGSPQRWYVQFHEDSVLAVEDLHPEVAKPARIQ